LNLFLEYFILLLKIIFRNCSVFQQDPLGNSQDCFLTVQKKTKLRGKFKLNFTFLLSNCIYWFYKLEKKFINQAMISRVSVFVEKKNFKQFCVVQELKGFYFIQDLGEYEKIYLSQNSKLE